ncbi:MAG TPA: FeoA domain-containing protein [Gemmatimonadota bacterium]|nr:FeoA domain-containing protein [Gemmatimonadota bacterium]
MDSAAALLPRHDVPSTLADPAPWQRLRIERIRRGPVLARCRELGLLPGVTLTWLRYEGGKVVVRFPEGHTTAIEVEAAPLIEVAPALTAAEDRRSRSCPTPPGDRSP